jgi:hypothetical protein
MNTINIITFILIWGFSALIIIAFWNAMVGDDDDNYPEP